MSDEKLMEHSERMARQEERMNTLQAKYESALDRLRVDIARRDTHIADRFADMARRDRDNTRWLVSIWIAGILLLGAWLRWPF